LKARIGADAATAPAMRYGYLTRIQYDSMPPYEPPKATILDAWESLSARKLVSSAA